jgi:hypothetical protein
VSVTADIQSIEKRYIGYNFFIFLLYSKLGLNVLYDVVYTHVKNVNK